MLSQFAIFEFRMYFVPGAYLFFLLNLIFKFAFDVSLTTQLGVENNFAESVVFILLAYILGHILQTLAHGFKFKNCQWSVDQTLRELYWKGKWSSELLLFKSEKIVEEATRQRILQALISNKIITESEAKIFEEPMSQEGSSLCQSVFYILLGKFEDDQSSGVKTSESNFYMLRGFYFASQIACVICSIICVIFFANFWNVTSQVVVLLLMSLCLLTLWRLFRYRCRGAGQGFVKKTFASIITHEIYK